MHSKRARVQTMTSETFAVQSANHTGFTVASLDSALKFLNELLGLPIVARREVDFGSGPNPVGIPNTKLDVALLSLSDGLNIELLQYLSPEDRAEMKARPCDVGHVHLAINVKNIKVLVAEAEKIGWTAAASEPVRIPRGGGVEWDVVYIRSPDGQTVELMEELDS